MDSVQTQDPFANESLITQSKLKQVAGGVSSMTIWRWRRDGVIPEPVSIRGRNYWRQGDVLTALHQLTTKQEAA